MLFKGVRMSYHPWLNERSYIPNRPEAEAASRAREAAGVLGQDAVNGRLTEAYIFSCV